MRVLVLCSTFPSVSEPTRGVFVYERIRRLASHCDLAVVSPVPWFPFNRWIRRKQAAVPSVDQRGGIVVHHPRFFSFPRYAKCLDGVFYFLCLVGFIARLRQTFPFDVVDAHFEFPDAVGATLLAKLFRRPIVVTLRGKLVHLSGYRLHRPQLQWMLRHADRVIAVSQYLRDIAGSLGISPQRVRVIRNGVDTDVFKPMEQMRARALCGLPLDRTILLTVGGLEARKGQHRVLEALPALIEEWPNLLYVMIGAGRAGDAYARNLERSVARLGLGRHVLFGGARPHTDLPAWFCAADVFVLLTALEGWPNVVLESLACGVPVVATRMGGVPEIVRDETDGILVPYDNGDAFRRAVLEALKRPWDRVEMVRYAHSLDWSAVTEGVLQEMSAAVMGRRA
jgi:glycosyltransferase involved in cell wall biosynthesis